MASACNVFPTMWKQVQQNTPREICHGEYDNGGYKTLKGNGVAQVLDYDPITMADFLNYTARSIGGTNTCYKDWILQVLKATRLPRDTVILATTYLVRHFNILYYSNVWETIVTCLILANKFWDDSTFTNRSWSEISGFDLARINILECAMLKNHAWSLLVDDSDLQWRAIAQSYGNWLYRSIPSSLQVSYHPQEVVQTVARLGKQNSMVVSGLLTPPDSCGTYHCLPFNMWR